MQNKITRLFGISYPIIQGGMIWVSGRKLAAAVSNAGGLGLIGGGSMRPEVFRQHIRKCRANTDRPFGVNIPLLYPYAEEQVKIAIEEGVKVVFTSAGSPKKYTARLHAEGIKVVHVVSNLKFALKSQEAGVDAVVAEGFEAGGHNGAEELTTLSLIPELAQQLSIPLIAAGGIGSGYAMAAALAAGADGVQIGSLFAATQESSAHELFKQKIVEAQSGDTRLLMKKHVPVRLLDNAFARRIMTMEAGGASKEELEQALGKGRAMRGMFEGDIDEGELEIGQIAGQIHKIKPVDEVMRQLLKEYESALQRLSDMEF